MVTPHNFPQPRIVVEIPGGFRVDDASGRRLGYFYSYPNTHLADVLTEDEARRMAEDFAKLP
jgi:hypothetical protein